MKYTKEKFLADVAKEAEALKKNANEKELKRLDFESLGQARCKWCGYKTTTGGILKHSKVCTKNPKNKKPIK